MKKQINIHDTPTNFTSIFYDSQNKWVIAYDDIDNFIEFIDTEHQMLSRYVDLDEEFNMSNVVLTKHPTQPLLLMCNWAKCLMYDYLKEEIIFEREGGYFTQSFIPQTNDFLLFSYEVNDDLYESDTAPLGTIAQYNAGQAQPTFQNDFSGSLNTYQLAWHPAYFAYVETPDTQQIIKFVNRSNYQVTNFSITPYQHYYQGMTFSPDGNYFIYVDEWVHVCDFPSLEKKYTLNDFGQFITEEDCYVWNAPPFYWSNPVVFQEQGIQVLACIRRGFLWFWELSSGQLLHKEKLGAGYYYSLYNVEGTSQLITCNADRPIFLIDPTDWIEKTLAKKEEN